MNANSTVRKTRGSPTTPRQIDPPTSGETQMATIVLVHGIAQEQLGRRRCWRRLAARPGRRSRQQRQPKTGRPDLARQILGRHRYSDGLLRHPVHRPGRPGRGRCRPRHRAAARRSRRIDRTTRVGMAAGRRRIRQRPHRPTPAQNDLAIIGGDVGQAQGPRATVGRPALNALAHLRWFAPFGMAVASKFVWRALTQVSRYLTDDEIRGYAQDQVLHWLGPDTRLVIGHSLGSVVAYEAIHRAHDNQLPNNHTLTLMTLGSPLGLQSIVYNRLRPQPPRVPPSVNRWENLAAQDDLVAANSTSPNTSNPHPDRPSPRSPTSSTPAPSLTTSSTTSPNPRRQDRHRNPQRRVKPADAKPRRHVIRHTAPHESDGVLGLFVALGPRAPLTC